MDSKNVPNIQRALVLQGGGSIGAYEAGVFNVLYYWIKKDIQNKKENIFDIVAGTSIGAINGAILVSYVQKNGTWDGVQQHLLKFWHSISSSPDLSNWWPYWFNWPLAWNENSWMAVWDQRHKDNPYAATGEAARRYFSAKEFILSGAPNVFSKPNKIYDNKFFDDFSIPSNTWYMYNNNPLKKNIKKNVNFPIKTSYFNKERQQQPIRQPRLLTISVDVEEGETVVFDSYAKKDGNMFTQYGYDEESKKFIQKIQYDKGLMIEHIIASASVPIHYDYTFVPIHYDYSNSISDEEREERIKRELQNSNLENYRRFWDGGILSNTPLRELVQSHQNYWTDVENADKIPNLEVYVVDVWPWMEEKNYPISSDYDSMINRKNGLTYQDKTPYDEKVINIVSDYFNLSKELLDLAKRKNATDDEIKEILDKQGKSTHRSGDKRQYRSLLENRFDITKLIRIERSGDPNDISNKWCDSSERTVNWLIIQGMEDTLNVLVKEFKGSKKALNQMDTFINTVNEQNINENKLLIEIAESIRNKL
jgi:predicted acylesterase/phospholipase RssA